MSPALKFLIGLVAVAAMTAISHGPLGNGAALIDAMEVAARERVAATEVPGVEVRLGRDPLSRLATLSGSADAFRAGLAKVALRTSRCICSWSSM